MHADPAARWSRRSRAKGFDNACGNPPGLGWVWRPRRVCSGRLAREAGPSRAERAKSVIFLTTLKSSEIYFYIFYGATLARKKSI